MKTYDMKESKFLKKEEVGNGLLLTITEISKENVAMQGSNPEMVWCMHFAELEKPMVLKSTNIQLAEIALGSDETDDWIGKKIVAYSDPNVVYKGEVTGGIRLRAVRGKAAQVNQVVPDRVAPDASVQRKRSFEEEMNATDVDF